MYEIYEEKSGRKVGTISEAGEVACSKERDRVRLEHFLQREIVVREGEEDELEPVLEETMCFFGMRTLRPGDCEYLAVALKQLPLLTEYQVKQL